MFQIRQLEQHGLGLSVGQAAVKLAYGSNCHELGEGVSKLKLADNDERSRSTAADDWTAVSF